MWTDVQEIFFGLQSLIFIKVDYICKSSGMDSLRPRYKIGVKFR